MDLDCLFAAVEFDGDESTGRFSEVDGGAVDVNFVVGGIGEGQASETGGADSYSQQRPAGPDAVLQEFDMRDRVHGNRLGGVPDEYSFTGGADIDPGILDYPERLEHRATHSGSARIRREETLKSVVYGIVADGSVECRFGIGGYLGRNDDRAVEVDEVKYEMASLMLASNRRVAAWRQQYVAGVEQEKTLFEDIGVPQGM